MENLLTQKSSLSKFKNVANYTRFDKSMLFLYIFLAKFPYEVLGVPSNYSKKITLERFKLLQHLFHPDKNPEISHQISAKINKAWVLFKQEKGFVNFDNLNFFDFFEDILKRVNFEKLTPNQKRQLENWFEEFNMAAQKAKQVAQKSEEGMKSVNLFMQEFQKEVEQIKAQE